MLSPPRPPTCHYDSKIAGLAGGEGRRDLVVRCSVKQAHEAKGDPWKGHQERDTNDVGGDKG